MSKYRFKTEEEFKRDGLWVKDHPNSWTSSGSMNKYLGQDIPDKYNRFCDVNKDFSYEGWSFSNDDYVLKETAFVLPSNWCIKVDRDCQPEEVYKWRQCSWIDAGYINNSTIWTDVVLDNYTEITLEQFKQHVLKESPVVETTKEVDMKEIQEEAKKRFPIGCKFIPVNGTGTYTLKEDSYTYTIHSKQIYAHDCHGTLYNNGKWATLVSSPETTKEMFHQGDYIVTLDVENGWNCAKKNYCFKQRMNFTGMAPAVDLNGSTSNSHGVMSFDKTQYLKDWRYATPEEAAEYERIGKPYDVTTLQKKEEPIPEYVECIEVPRGWSITEKGVIYKIDSFDSVKGYFRLIFDKGGQKVTSEKHCFKPSTKEAYEAQNAPKQLKATPPPSWSDTSELTPLEICKQKYRKGMRVMSADNSGMFSGEFTIEVDPDKFTITGAGVDYHYSRGWLYFEGKYAEILDETTYVGAYDPYQIEEVKKETFIENVQSVNVELISKKKIRIF